MIILALAAWFIVIAIYHQETSKSIIIKSLWEWMIK